MTNLIKIIIHTKTSSDVSNEVYMKSQNSIYTGLLSTLNPDDKESMIIFKCLVLINDNKNKKYSRVDHIDFRIQNRCTINLSYDESYNMRKKAFFKARKSLIEKSFLSKCDSNSRGKYYVNPLFVNSLTYDERIRLLDLTSNFN